MARTENESHREIRREVGERRREGTRREGDMEMEREGAG